MDKAPEEKYILITGGTSGLGLQLSLKLAENGLRIVVTGRNCPAEISGNPNIDFIRIDFADLSDVRRKAGELATYRKFDLIVNNAGVLSPPGFTKTSDNFEYTFQVNFLSHLLLNEILLESATRNQNIKLAWVTSPVSRVIRPGFRFPDEDHYKPFRVYSETKYYMLLAGLFLKQMHKDKDIVLLGLDPGTFSSGIYRMQKGWFRNMYKTGALFMRSPAKVANGFIRILSSPRLKGDRVYIHNREKNFPFPAMTDEAERFLFSCYDAVKVVR